MILHFKTVLFAGDWKSIAMPLWWWRMIDYGVMSKETAKYYSEACSQISSVFLAKQIFLIFFTQIPAIKNHVESYLDSYFFTKVTP